MPSKYGQSLEFYCSHGFLNEFIWVKKMTIPKPFKNPIITDSEINRIYFPAYKIPKIIWNPPAAIIHANK